MQYKKQRGVITVTGAREHNLKNISVTIPKEQLCVITGPSGSGKSSLALDILFTEGKRRYMESLSSYARQFLGIAKKPEVDSIEGLCPAIAIEQKTVSSSPRSTVGTITEINDYLRVLFARVGVLHCPTCSLPISAEGADAITHRLMNTFSNLSVTFAAPIARQQKGEFVSELVQHFTAGRNRFLIDGVKYKFNLVDEIKALKLGKTYKHTIDLLIDTCEVTQSNRARVQEAVEKAFSLTDGLCKVFVGEAEHVYSSKRMCLQCMTSFVELEPRLFSFNAPVGACTGCNGLGIIHEWPWQEGDANYWKSQYPDFFGRYAQVLTCTDCLGRRLNKMALSVTVGGKNIFDVGQLSIADALRFFADLTLDETQRSIASGLIREVSSRLGFLYDVGLSYLSLNRSARTLSGGEGQRIRLATQIGSALSGVLYILDEPSIGLHQRDNDRLITTLKKLRDQGNSVVVVEHDLDTITSADYVIDMGPAAGIHGGQVIAVGSPQELARNSASLTGAYIAGRRKIHVPAKRRKPQGFMTISHAAKNNLKDITVGFPLGVLCGISGVSGSGKSTLIMEEVVPALERELRRAPTAHDDLTGVENLEALVVVDQSPIGRTPRSNPATYLKLFDEIRALFAQLPESLARGYRVGRFSFNVAEGRCFECSGDGTITVSMQFLPDVVMTCKTCQGKRYNHETLQIRYKGKSIADVLEMSAIEALDFFTAHKNIAKRLQLLCDVGLDYITLGQSSVTLSGGEAQRIKLVDELAKRGSKTLYVLDEPTTGLHTSDIERLLLVLNKLVDKGNSLIVIEHNLDVLKTVDYLIDMGPEGGVGGGQVVAQGTPESVAHTAGSHTGLYLRKLL